MEGKGILYYNEGHRYKGEFKNNLKEGKGIDYCSNGDKYIGEFKMVKEKEKEYIIIMMVIDMKEIGKII